MKAPIVVLALFVLLLSTFSVVVPVGAQEIQWIKQFGTIDSDFPCGVSADQSGVYVAGTVEDQPLPGQTSAGKTDIFVRKYDFDGNEKWTRQFGSSEDDECGGISAFSSDVSADASGVYVTGATSGTLPAQRMSGIQDAFVRKYDFDGNVVWTKQFGVSNARTRSNGISVHLSGVYIAGDTTGNLGGQNPSPGSLNPFVRKHDFQGNHVWTQQFGDGSAFGVSAHDSGIYVRGLSSHGVGFLRKYNLLGTLEFEIGLYLFGLSVQDKGVYVTGRANDGDFVGQYDFTGGLVWRIISPAPAPQLAQVSVSTDGVYIEGIGTGPQDIIVRKYDFDGNQLWTQSFGTSGSDVGFRISARALDAYVVGTTTGAFAGYEHLGRTDIFLAKLAGIRTDLPFDYKIVLSSSRGTVLQSTNIVVGIDVSLSAGVGRNITFSHSNLPPGITATFSPSSCIPMPTCSSSLAISADPSAQPGKIDIAITANPSGSTPGDEIATFSLTVLPHFSSFSLSPLFESPTVQRDGRLTTYLQVTGTTATSSGPVNDIPIELSSPSGRFTDFSSRFQGIDGIVQASFSLSGVGYLDNFEVNLPPSYLGVPIQTPTNPVVYHLGKRVSDLLFGTTVGGSASLEASVEGQITNEFNVTDDGADFVSVEALQEWKGGLGVDWHLFQASVGPVGVTVGGGLVAGILADKRHLLDNPNDATQSRLISQLITRWVLSNLVGANPLLDPALDAYRTLIDGQNAPSIDNHLSELALGGYFKASACVGFFLGVNAKGSTLDTPCDGAFLDIGAEFEAQGSIHEYSPTRLGFRIETAFSASVAITKSFLGIGRIGGGIEVVPIEASLELVYDSGSLSTLEVEFRLVGTRDLFQTLSYSGLVQPLEGLSLPGFPGFGKLIVHYSVSIDRIVTELRSALSSLQPGDIGLGGLFGILDKLIGAVSNTPVLYQVSLQTGVPISISVGVTIAGVGLHVGFQAENGRRALLDTGFLFKFGKWPVVQYSTIPASVDAIQFIGEHWLCELGCPFKGLVAKKHEAGHDLFLHLRDQENRHVGLNYQTGNVDLQIPGSYYSDNQNGTSKIALTELPSSASYTIDVDAAFVQLSLESYNLTVISLTPDKIGQFNITATIPKSTIQHYDASVHNEIVQTRLSGTLDMNPRVLNTRSTGKYVKGHVELPQGFDVSSIDPSSISLNGAVPLAPGAPVTIGDHDSDGIPDLTVKFNRQSVNALFSTPGTYALHITGNCASNGRSVPFEAFAFIRVISTP